MSRASASGTWFSAPIGFGGLAVGPDRLSEKGMAPSFTVLRVFAIYDIMVKLRVIGPRRPWYSVRGGPMPYRVGWFVTGAAVGVIGCGYGESARQVRAASIDGDRTQGIGVRPHRPCRVVRPSCARARRTRWILVTGDTSGYKEAVIIDVALATGIF